MNGIEYEKCLCCDGTGEVHSHNPTCWICGGSGIATKQQNELQKQQDEWIKKLKRPTTWDYQ